LPKPTDIWSFGVCLYTFVCQGRVPFYAQSEIEMQINSQKNELEFPEGLELSPPLKDFLQRLLTKDPQKRPTVAQLLQDPFFVQPQP